MVKPAIFLFIIIFLLLAVLPEVAGIFMTGSSCHGFPFTYHMFSSSSLPAFGREFMPWAFAADLAIYFVIAFLIAWIRKKKKRPGGIPFLEMGLLVALLVPMVILKARCRPFESCSCIPPTPIFKATQDSLLSDSTLNATLSVLTKQKDVEITLDGKPMGTTPLWNKKIHFGKHHLELLHRHYPPFDTVFRLDTGITEFSFNMER